MFILDHRALQKHQQYISSVQELEHLVAYALSHYALGTIYSFKSTEYHITRGSGLFSPKFVWQFGLLIFDFSKRLDGCAVIWICQPALPGHQFALRVSLVEQLLPF